MPSPEFDQIYTPPVKAPSKNTKPPKKRMGGRLLPLPRIYDPQDLAKVKKVVKKPAPRGVQLTSKAPVDDQFTVRVFFSEAFGDNAGSVWREPLEIEDRTEWASKEFFWRCEIDQFRVDPLLQGFKIEWQILTPGWTFVDGVAVATYEEAISNPLKVVRVIKAPSSITVRPKFRVVVRTKYLP